MYVDMCRVCVCESVSVVDVYVCRHVQLCVCERVFVVDVCMCT